MKKRFKTPIGVHKKKDLRPLWGYMKKKFNIRDNDEEKNI